MCSLSWNVSCSTGESAICLGGLGESCYERFHWSVSRRRRDGLLFPPVSERHPQSQRDRTENGLLKQRRNSFICSLSSRACVRTARRRGGGVRASGSAQPTTVQFFGPSMFPVATWNQHAAGPDGTARSTSAGEGWHHGLQSLFLCRHPTVWTFMRGIQHDMQRRKGLFLQATAGITHPSAKKCRALNDRVNASSCSLWTHWSSLLVYLRSIAHLSQS